jgi:hypothetical protein
MHREDGRMTRQESEQRVRNTFEKARPRMVQLAGRLVDDAEAAVEEAAKIFDRMIPAMAYVDEPDHPMASAVFGCSANLALYLAAKERGVDVHDFGSAMLAGLAKAPPPEAEEPRDDRPIRERFAGFIATAEASQKGAAPGEFVFEAFLGDRTEFDWGMNVKSCAICFAFSKYDALDLVPYMCATDDVVSDQGGQGLRRSGTIALGAHQCDFRYKRGGETQRLAEKYPDRIQVVKE